MKEQLISWGLDILGPIVAALVSWLLFRFGLWIKGRTKNEKARALIDLAVKSAQVGVKATEARLRPTLKALAPDGKLTPEEGATLRAAAVDAMRYDLGPAASEALRSALDLGHNEFQRWMEAQVEAANLTLSSKDLGLR